MPLATKNGSLIIKDGKVAENCNCCAWYCSTGCCTDLTTGLYAQSALCDCTGASKHYSADWSNASGGCAPCAFLFPYNVSVTATYTGPTPVVGMSDAVVAASNGTRTYSPTTCNGSLYSDMLSFGLFPTVWFPSDPFAYYWGPFSFNYENAGGGLWRQVIWLLGWPIAPVTANSDFRYKISHDCSGPESSWAWINGLSLSYSTVYRSNNTLLPGGNLSLVFNSFDALQVSANATNLGSWVRRC